MRPRRTPRPVPFLAALLLAATACSGGFPDRPRAVVIGIDSADWRIIDRLVEAGRMPNLAALRARGTSGPMKTLVEFPLSPVVWTSVATGKTPAKHGVTWFLVDQPDGRRVPVRSTNRKAAALWNILAARGLRSTTIGWWASYPAEDVGESVIVSDALGFHGFGRTAREGDDGRKTHPAERYAELEALVPPEQQLGADFALRFLHIEPEQYRNARYEPARGAPRDPDNPVQLFQQYAVTAQGYTAIAEKLLGEPYDVFLLYYEQVDSFSHLFMKYAPPRLDWIPEEDFARFRDVVDEWYAYQDELLGRVLAKVDLGTTAVFVLSDHGFKSGERRVRSERAVNLDVAHLEHEPDGIFVAAGPGIRHGASVEDASVLDLTPTLLHYLDLPVGKDMDGKVLEAIFEPDTPPARMITYVASYEGEVAHTAPAPPGDVASDEELAQNEAQLAALGYVQPAAPEDVAEESSPEMHDNMARIHLREGKLDAAAAEFEKALALASHDADALLGLSGIAALRGNRDQAEHLAKVALASNPDFPPALAQLAQLRRDAGDLPGCVQLFRQAIGLNDSQPDLYLGLGDCLQRSGQYDDAKAQFERVLELLPDSFAARYDLGVTAFQQGDEEAAIAHFEHALAVDPSNPLAGATLNNLGTVYLDLGKRDQAIERWQQAAAASPAQFEARYNLASAYLDDGRVDDAIPLLEQAARLAPNHQALHVMLARAYMAKGRNQEAFRALTLVHRLYPENWFAPLGMAALLAGAEQAEQAKPLLEAALSTGGTDARKAAEGYPALAPLLAATAQPDAP